MEIEATPDETRQQTQEFLAKVRKNLFPLTVRIATGDHVALTHWEAQGLYLYAWSVHCLMTHIVYPERPLYISGAVDQSEPYFFRYRCSGPFPSTPELVAARRAAVIAEFDLLPKRDSDDVADQQLLALAEAFRKLCRVIADRRADAVW